MHSFMITRKLFTMHVLRLCVIYKYKEQNKQHLYTKLEILIIYSKIQDSRSEIFKRPFTNTV